MEHIEELITEEIKTVGIAGHVNPDGDCVGSCTALWQYLRNSFPGLLKVDLYLELPKPALRFLNGVSESRQEAGDEVYDLFVTCDVSSLDRIAVAGDLFARAKRTACIDHHVSNPLFADINHVEADASSCAEVLCGLMDPAKVDAKIAESLYTGIIHDTGVFQYSNTTPRTLRYAAGLIEKGVPFSRIIDDSFNKRTYLQARMMGYVLEKARLYHGGQVIASFVTIEELEDHGVTKSDLDMDVSELRLTEGCEAAVFAYEIEPGVFKVSLRSNEYLDVADVALAFGGGGHVRAAGCTISGEGPSVIEKVLTEIEPRLRK